MHIVRLLVGPYYGFDWLGLSTQLLSIVLLAGRNRTGFLLGAFVNASLIVYSTLAGSIADPIGNSILLVLNIRGYLIWRRDRLETQVQQISYTPAFPCPFVRNA